MKLQLTMCLLLLGAPSARAENWPNWRGPQSNGISKETGLPAEWSKTTNIAWKLPMPGMGGSTPIIWDNRIFLTSSDRGDLVLLCVSTDGKELWKRKLAASGKVFKKDEANQASASPCTDGKHVWAFVGTGDLACFDFEGNEIWKFNAQSRYGAFQIQHGIHTTPVLHEDRLYLSLLHSNAHWVIALDKKSGKEVWKVARRSDAEYECKEAYTTPCIWRDTQDACLVVLGCDYTTAHRLTDGGEIWRLGDLNPKSRYMPMFRIISSPVAATEDLLVVPTARGATVVALKPGAKGMIKPGSEFEQWRVAKGSPDVPSPLAHDGLVYLCRESGVLIVLDAKTGKELYQKRVHPTRHRASPVYADGKIYLTARDGTFNVIQAGPEYKLLATNTLPDDFAASPAVSGGRIYLRGFRTLYAVQQAQK
jgi:outer membrane protein assembly factor BamB